MTGAEGREIDRLAEQIARQLFAGPESKQATRLIPVDDKGDQIGVGLSYGGAAGIIRDLLKKRIRQGEAAVAVVRKGKRGGAS